jgi:hypothetical protein
MQRAERAGLCRVHGGAPIRCLHPATLCIRELMASEAEYGNVGEWT